MLRDFKLRSAGPLGPTSAVCDRRLADHTPAAVSSSCMLSDWLRWMLLSDIASYSLIPGTLLDCGSGGTAVSCYRVQIRVTTTGDLAGFMLELSGSAVYDPPGALRTRAAFIVMLSTN